MKKRLWGQNQTSDQRHRGCMKPFKQQARKRFIRLGKKMIKSIPSKFKRTKPEKSVEIDSRFLCRSEENLATVCLPVGIAPGG